MKENSVGQRSHRGPYLFLLQFIKITGVKFVSHLIKICFPKTRRTYKPIYRLMVTVTFLSKVSSTFERDYKKSL